MLGFCLAAFTNMYRKTLWRTNVSRLLIEFGLIIILYIWLFTRHIHFNFVNSDISSQHMLNSFMNAAGMGMGGWSVWSVEFAISSRNIVVDNPTDTTRWCYKYFMIMLCYFCVSAQRVRGDRAQAPLREWTQNPPIQDEDLLPRRHHCQVPVLVLLETTEEV